jgi:DNA-binding transcriptional LysR family regulator
MMSIIRTEYPGDLLLHLGSFVALMRHVRSGSRSAFERAAADLHVDRSVLRRRIQSLSSWVGVPLLHGRGSSISPTVAGARLEERAGRMLLAARELAEEVATSRERITIACTGTVTTELLPRVLVELEARPRAVQLVVRRAGGTACERLVRAGDVDLGIVRATSAPALVASQHLADDRLWFVLPRAHPLGARRELTLAEMASVPLVLYGESSRTRARVMEALGPLGASIRVEVDGRAAALEYVRRGLGATFLSLLPAHRVGADVRARDVTPLFARSAFYAIGRADRWSAPVVRDVVSSLARHAQRRAT